MTWYADLLHDQAGGHGGVRSITQMVVIHATFNTASDEDEAHFAEHRSDQVSAHFYNDDDSVIQALDTDWVAYGCYPTGNNRSVQFELTGLDWDTANAQPGDVTDATMREVAPVVARVCEEYGLPIRKIGPSDLVNGVKGICGHADVTRAWGEGDHLDPGPYFPWSTFISYVQAAADPPAVVAEGDCDMVSGEVHEGTERTMIGLDDVNSGLAKNGPAWLSFVTDPALLAEKGVDSVRLRVAVTDGKGWNVLTPTLSKTGWRQSIQLDTGINGIRVDRLDLVATAVEPGGELDKDNDPAGHVEIGYCVMYGPKRA